MGLVMADVSDQGMSAARIRAEARRNPSPKMVLRNDNRLLLEMNPAGLFVTVFYGVIDLAQGKLHYVRAGHDKPLYYSPQSGECWFLEGEGMSLGLMGRVRFEEVEVDMWPGDLLILYTDGVTNTKSPTDEFFGRERLQQAVCDAGDASAEELYEFILQRVEQFEAGAVQYDETALLVARVG